jgi:type I restriction enzyme, R subunit
MKQYQEDRDPADPLFAFRQGCLVHFAVDTEEVWMTTRLDKAHTHFLPFNRGHNNGAGNPPDADRGYRTSYLWLDILSKDSLLEIIARFLHLENGETLIW